MQLNFEAEAKSLTQMPKGPEAKAKAKLLASADVYSPSIFCMEL